MRLYVCITGDLFHYGHIEFFKRARQFGDHLTVGVCSDKAVEKYKRHPILTLQERLAVIEECKLVDNVIAGAPASTSRAFIRKHKIDLVVASRSYSKQQLEKYFSAAIKLNMLELVDYETGISSTEIIKRCHDRYQMYNGELGKF